MIGTVTTKPPARERVGMLSEHIPSDVSDRAASVLDERVPNYCPDCGAAVKLAGGADERVSGLYPHIDPVVMCPDCGRRFRHGAAFNQKEGHRHYELNRTRDEGDDTFGAVVGWCNLHTRFMEVTKDMVVRGEPARQFKCPECDLVNTVVAVDPD